MRPHVPTVAQAASSSRITFSAFAGPQTGHPSRLTSNTSSSSKSFLFSPIDTAAPVYIPLSCDISQVLLGAHLAHVIFCFAWELSIYMPHFWRGSLGPLIPLSILRKTYHRVLLRAHCRIGAQGVFGE